MKILFISMGYMGSSAVLGELFLVEALRVFYCSFGEFRGFLRLNLLGNAVSR